MTIDTLVETFRARITAVDGDAAISTVERWDQLAKPPGSLGHVEPLGVRLSAIAGRCPPPIPRQPHVIITAGDHGVHGRGVSDWPQQITKAMVDTVRTGRATINAIAATVHAAVVLLDVGTVGARHPNAQQWLAAPELVESARGTFFCEARVGSGTGDLSRTAAMSVTECALALSVGASLTAKRIEGGADLIALGDLGIGNTTASACLIAAMTATEPQMVTGNGANVDESRLERKIAVVTAALQRHGSSQMPLSVLASLGGFEHAAMVGVLLEAAARRIPVVLDGVTTNAAALVAVALVPQVAGYLIAGHRSAEPGARAALEHLGLEPVIDKGLRLGEGTGAALAIPIVVATAAILNQVAMIDDIAR